MRICYLCSDLGIPINGIKGASAHARGFVRALSSAGHEVAIISSDQDGAPAFEIPIRRIPQTNIFDFLSDAESPRVFRALKHICNNVNTEQVMERVIHEFGPDLIYERYSPFAAAGSAVSRKHDIFHILEVNALLSLEGKTYRKQALQEAIEYLEMEAFRLSSLIITVSDVLKEDIISSGIPPEKIITIPNGVDDIFFKKPSGNLRQGFNGKCVIGFVGSLKPWHGIESLIECFRLLADDPVFHLLVVGEGNMMKMLKKLQKEFPEQVTLAGGVAHEQVPEYIDAMDITVAPYPPFEKFYFSPLKILEYMARGKAVIASDQGQIRDMIDHGETGWLIRPGDTDELVSAIRLLSADLDLRRKLGRRAEAAAEKQHSWHHRIAMILQHVNLKKS
jgi:glycosyltransferase involved in cell wall biosynthesis